VRPARRRRSYGAIRCQYGDLWRPASVADDVPLPLVVLFHGGFWRAVYTRRLMDRLAGDVVLRGWAAWNVEYRRVGPGGHGGGWPATFDDALAALRAVDGLEGVDTKRVVTCGHSAGGHLALWTAAVAARGAELVGGKLIDRRGEAVSGRSRIVPVAAISLAGVVDLVAAEELALGNGVVHRLMGGSPAARAEPYRQASLLEALPTGVRQVIVHGTDDTVVPSVMAERYARRAMEAGDDVDLVMVQDADHMSMIDPQSKAWRATVDRIGEVVS
jgi:acetyl esterase/lipase